MTNLNELREQLDQWKSEIGQLEHRIRQTHGDKRVERCCELYHLRRDHINLHKQLDDLMQADDDRAGHSTTRLEAVKEDFARKLRNASSKIQ